MKDPSPVIMMIPHLPATEEEVEVAEVKEMLQSQISVLVYLVSVFTLLNENWRNSLEFSVALRNVKLFLMDTLVVAVALHSFTLKQSMMQMPPESPWMGRSWMDDQSESTSQSLKDHILQHLGSTWEDRVETQEAAAVEDSEEDAEVTVIEDMEAEIDMVVIGTEMTEEEEIDIMKTDTGIDTTTEETTETDTMREEVHLLQVMTEVILMREEEDTILILLLTAMERGQDQGHQVHMRETQGQDASIDLEVVNMKGDIKKLRY